MVLLSGSAVRMSGWKLPPTCQQDILLRPWYGSPPEVSCLGRPQKNGKRIQPWAALHFENVVEGGRSSGERTAHSHISGQAGLDSLEVGSQVCQLGGLVGHLSLAQAGSFSHGCLLLGMACPLRQASAANLLQSLHQLACPHQKPSRCAGGALAATADPSHGEHVDSSLHQSHRVHTLHAPSTGSLSLYCPGCHG